MCSLLGTHGRNLAAQMTGALLPVLLLLLLLLVVVVVVVVAVLLLLLGAVLLVLPVLEVAPACGELT
jgi:hypothetical protein